MPESPGIGDSADAEIERQGKYVTIEIQVAEAFEIPLKTILQSLKELSGRKIIKSFRVR